MTQSYNLSQLANNLNTAGQLDATDGLSGAVPANNGGTGLSSYTTGDILYASGGITLAALSDIAIGNALITGGAGAAPSYGKIGLTTHISGTLGLGNGGTNATSTPVAGSVIIGTGSAYASTAAGTAGQVLVSNGSSAPTWGSAGGQLQAALFSSTGTWTAPANVTRVKVTVIGGGGGGGYSGQTGGRGGFGFNYYTVVPLTTYSVVVGLGGVGSGTSPINGSAGGNSTFHTFITATGGAGGIYYTSGQAAAGSCANSLVNTTSSNAVVPSPFWGVGTNSGGSTAVNWTASSGYIPGACGLSVTSEFVIFGSGGVSGIVFIEYVG